MAFEAERGFEPLCSGAVEPMEVEVYNGYTIWSCIHAVTRRPFYFVWGLSDATAYFLGDLREYIDTVLAPAGIEPAEPHPDRPERPPEVEEPPPELIPFVNLPSLPWYAAWLEPVLNYLGNLTGGVVNHVRPVLEGILALGDFFKNPIKAVIDRLGDLFSSGSTDSGVLSVKILKDLKEGSPEWEEEARGLVAERVAEAQGEGRGRVFEEIDITKVKTHEQAVEALQGLSDKLLVASAGNFVTHAILESASLGQFEWFSQIEPMVIGKMGMSKIIERASMLPVEKAVLIKAEQAYNYQYTPLIPTYTDLINMVVKEKITIEQFKTYMRLQGYSADFAQLIWDSHFIAPSLGQLLTSFRRGTIDASRLTELQILVDLDPIYNDIWFDQWYRDPTPRQGRFMYEAGAIDVDRLRDIVVRSGLLPDDVEAFTEYLATFNERSWKRRYIIEVARGYRLDVIPEDELRSEVMGVYYSEGIADWVVMTENIAKRIEAAKPVVAKEKLLTLGDLKRAYVFGKLGEDSFRSELLGRGYDMGDIDLMIEVLNEDRLAKVEGARIVRLTKSELLQAFKQEEITEDELRSRLLGMGLDMLEVNILINTKRKQWGLEAA